MKKVYSVSYYVDDVDQRMLDGHILCETKKLALEVFEKETEEMLEDARRYCGTDDPPHVSKTETNFEIYKCYATWHVEIEEAEIYEEYSEYYKESEVSEMERRWMNVELDRETAPKFAGFLVMQGYKFESSGCYNLVHFEIYVNDVERDICDEWLSK